MRRLSLSIVLLAAFSGFAGAPEAPVIIEPSTDGQVLFAADVHMAVAPFQSDAGHAHLCSDWQIFWTDQLAWTAPCVTGSEKNHIHLGNGKFVTNHQALRDGYEYRLRVRHRDDSGIPDSEWSAWSERTFVTAPPQGAQQLSMRDVFASPVPQWTRSSGEEIVLPAGAVARLETVDGVLFFAWRGTSSGVVPTDGAPLPSSAGARLVLKGGAQGWEVGESSIVLFDDNGSERTIVLPGSEIAPMQQVVYWISGNGSTFHGEANERSPDFSRVARLQAIPWSVLPGYRIEHVAGDLRLPVALAFVPSPREDAGAPLLYVAELYGGIKVVTRGGAIHDYAKNLLNFITSGTFPGDGEIGLAAIIVEPESGDLFATLVYDADPPNAVLRPKVVRIRSSDGGLTASAVETVLAVDVFQAPSHQISAVTLGPDRKLYVHIADGFKPELATDLTSPLGKILRINLDGSAPEDNPFYNASDGVGVTDFIYALGFRNPFGGSWRAADRSLYEVENGPATDRLAKVVAGRNYGWDGTDASMQTFAICTFANGTAPVNLAFIQSETFGGSGFPPDRLGHLFITESGPTWASGTPSQGKRVSEVSLWDDGTLAGGPTSFIQYNGTGKATVAGLAAGPDGLYFTDLYRDHEYVRPSDRGANVFRARWVGAAGFAIAAASQDPMTIQFVDRSTAEPVLFRSWDFGDGATSTEPEPVHSYERPGAYLVRLTVTGGQGPLAATKLVHVENRGTGLATEYYSDPDLTTLLYRDTSPAIDFTGDDPSGPGLPESSFSVRWKGRIRPRLSENYRLIVRASEDVRLWIDGREIIDRNTPLLEGERVGEVELRAGALHDIVLELSDGSRQTSAQLFWESASQTRELVPPSSFLLPDSPRRRAVSH